MTNWPGIQEYRNFETKFIDDPKLNVITDSAASNHVEVVIKDEIPAKNNEEDIINNQKLQNTDSKIVRCVIKKDFEETFKKVERDDGNQEHPRPKAQEVTTVDRLQDKIRLQNHLKWKKQKEEEYLQRKEVEKIAQKKKKEEEERLEKLKKQKEKEKIEKLKEWQEQKAREKEEKRKEKMVIKMLEEELKVTPSVDKEKLLEEWVKLKNKQKQIEAEKKAQLLRKEEESRALRQALADLSYRQWKERVKGRIVTLPKNGYQIFGPKPVPVVKEDWNHDFIYSSPRSPKYNLRNQESTTTLTFCPPVKDLEDYSRDIFYIGHLKNRSPSFSQLKRMKSGFNLTDSYPRKGRCEMPLKELQPGSVDFNHKGGSKVKNGFQKTRDFTSNDLKSDLSFLSKYDERPTNLTDLMCFPGAQGDQNRCVITAKKKPLELINSFPDAQILPNKKKIDLYINTNMDSTEENSVLPNPKKKTVTNNDAKIHKEVKREKTEKKPSNETTKNTPNEKSRFQNRARSQSMQKFDKNQSKSSSGKKSTEQDNVKIKPCRRTQSCDKSQKKTTKNELGMKNCKSSKSMVKVVGTGDESRKALTKSKTNCSQKRKSRKATDPFEIKECKSEKKLWEPEVKNKKKLKRKNSLSKSFSFIDSPYCSKTSSKILSKAKTGRKRNTKDIETKSDEVGRCRKLSTTKI